MCILLLLWYCTHVPHGCPPVLLHNRSPGYIIGHPTTHLDRGWAPMWNKHSCTCTACNLMLCTHLGLLYTYLAKECERLTGHGAFRALQRGYIHWASGRLSQIEVNCQHPKFCHVRCSMTPSMKSGVYHVYVLLGREGELATIEKATCQCAAG